MWLAITLFVFSSGPAFANSLPFKGVPGYAKDKYKFESYYPMKVDFGKTRQTVHGNYWEMTYKSAEALDLKAFFSTLDSFNPNARLLHERRDKRLYAVTRGDRKYLIQITHHGKWYQLKAILKQPYQAILALSQEQPLNYAARISDKLPDHLLLPRIDGYQVYRADCKDFNSLKLSYRDSENKRKKTEVEGKFWKLEYQKVDRDGHNHRYQLAHNFRDELIRLRGEILEEDGSNLAFFRTTGDAEQWGQLSAFAETLVLKFVEKAAFQQSLFIDPDELQAQLDASGQVTLKGIYFDTGKATLKPASSEAINAVVALMKKHPDLVIQVQGHTDNVGSEEANQLLSAQRSAAVKDAIIGAGIPARQLESQGYGESRPVATNATEEGRKENRRVELHKLSGGEQRAIITIDFLKTMPQAVLAAERNYQQSKLIFKGTTAAGKNTNRTVIGDKTSYEYKFQDQEGKPIRTISRLEVLRNYETALGQLGADSLFTKGNTLYFEFKDRGDGVPVMGTVQAFNGTYTINFYIMAATSDKREKSPAAHKNEPAPAIELTGKWIFDTQASIERAGDWEERNFVLYLERLTFDFQPDGNCILADGSKGTVHSRQSGAFTLQLDKDNQISFVLKQDRLFGKMPWGKDGFTISPVFVRAEKAEPYELDIHPFLFDTQYHAKAEQGDINSYCMFLKNGQLVFSEQPIDVVSEAMMRTNRNRVINLNGKILVNGGMMTVTPKGNGFLLDNQGLVTEYLR